MNERIKPLYDNLNIVIVGKEQVVKYMLTAIIAGGHVLIEDVPGCGKTTLARALSKLISADFKRVQFTPDMLPADITGLTIYNTKINEFEFKKGPIFTDILLADEINRATPRTQSALIECMQERQVTYDGTTYELSDEFFVIATENPIETAGTFTLPEAILDRFFMQLELGYPSKEDEIALMTGRLTEDPIDSLESIITVDDIRAMKSEAVNIFIHPCLIEYIADIAAASRNADAYVAGVSPRGSLTLLNSAKAYAYINGRNYVTPDDIQELTIPVLAHRLVPASGYMSRAQAIETLKNVVNSVQVPTENFRG